MPVSFVYVYACQLHSDIDREEQQKYPFLLLCGNTGYSLVTVHALGSIDHSEKVKGQLCFVFRVV